MSLDTFALLLAQGSRENQASSSPESTGEETTGIVNQAGDAAQNTASQTADFLRPFRDFYHAVVSGVTSTEFLAKVIASVVVVMVAIVLFRIVTRGVPRILRWTRSDDDTWDEEMVARVKRQDTAITLIRNALRYVVFVVVALFIVAIFVGNPIPAAAGVTIIAAVIGFGAQSFLRDIIAGFSIIFEGQYSVGDFIEVEPQKMGGIVEELGLRTTKIRTLSGEVAFIPNGTVIGVKNYVTGQQRFNIEVQVRDLDAAERVANSLGEAAELYVTPPRLLTRREEDDGRVRLRIRAGVLPSMSWLVEENLTERIKGAAGEESLASEPLISQVDQASLRRIKDLLPQDKKNVGTAARNGRNAKKPGD